MISLFLIVNLSISLVYLLCSYIKQFITLCVILIQIYTKNNSPNYTIKTIKKLRFRIIIIKC